MASSALKRKTAKGLFWGGFSNGITQLVGLAYGIVLARRLSQEDYGIVALLAIFTGIAGTLSGGGFSIALTNKQDAGHRDYNAVFWFSTLMSVFLYVVMFCLAPIVAGFYDTPELTVLSRVFCITFITSGAAVTAHTVMFKRMMVKRLAVIDILSLFVSCSAGLYLAFTVGSYWAIAVQVVLYISVASILKIIVAPWRPTFDIDFSPLKQMFPFSIKLVLTSIFSSIYAYVLPSMLGKLYNLSDVGNYNQGQKWSTMGHTLTSTMIGYVVQPVLVESGENRSRRVAVIRKLIRFGAFISFPLMLGLAFVGREFIVIAIGEKWLPAVPFLQLSCIWGAVMFLFTIFGNVIYTNGKSGMYMTATITTGMMQMLAVILMYPYGILPMVGAYVAMSVVGLFVWHYYVDRLVGLPLRFVFRDIFPYLFLTVLCIFVAWLLTGGIDNLYVKFFLKVAITVLLYVIVLWAGKSVIFRESISFLTKTYKK
ncbi:MAG: lipopolysaccharide biosynthesis protein [Dysgonamonadaceae bacterium]|jgi:O-antigen/teichoic acid export membrane protein|nr:lipopolysaccharide biosynthesis protein [Dysgonamonadaceae bacterium]